MPAVRSLVTRPARWGPSRGALAVMAVLTLFAQAGPAAASDISRSPPGPHDDAASPANPIGAPPAPGAEAMPVGHDAADRLTIPVTVDGKGPFSFIVDTGSDRTVLSRELAQRLALPAGPPVVMHQTTGVDTVGTAHISDLRVGARRAGAVDAPLVPAAALGAEGMIGVDSLRNLRLVMDFQTRKMTSEPSAPEPNDGHTVVVRGRSRFGYLVLVDAAIKGSKIYVIVDSGSQMSVGNPALEQLLLGAGPRAGDGRVVIESVTGRKMDAAVALVDEADVGGLEIRNMPLAFAELHTFDHLGLTDRPSLLLGMDVLSHCRRFAVDLKRQEAAFTVE